MRYVKKAAPDVCMVLKGMLFIGFSIQIVLGICWICCNFGQTQNFGEPDSALYGALLGLFGGSPGAMYTLQLASGFFAGFLFLQKLRPSGPWFAVWRGMALLTFPFVLQCHLSLQPYSLMGSCFLLFLLALLKVRRRHGAALLLAALACGAAFTGLSGAVDSDRRDSPGYSLEGALASRFAWPTIWNDFGWYGGEAAGITEEIAWEASLCPDNMEIFQERLESQAGTEAAKEFYLLMAKTGWDYHAFMVIRQIGWDALGYAVTPVIFQLQMKGEAYDSYTGRNYESMRKSAPVLTRDYVDYGCWWFLWMLAISLPLALLETVCVRAGEAPGGLKRFRRRLVWSVALCLFVSGLLVAALTMRGAGKMDYRLTIAVNELWLAGPLLLMGRGRPGREGCG